MKRGDFVPRRAPSLLLKDAVAIFHFDVNNVSRAAGESAVNKAAYLAGVRLVDHRTGLVHDFSDKAAEILARDHAGPVDWQAVEQAERRRDAKVARTIIVALPCELDPARQRRLAAWLGGYLRRRHGVAVEWAIHAAPTASGGDKRNVHLHLLLTTRQVSDEGVIGVKVRELDRSATARGHIGRWREMWAALANRTLANQGSDERIDHRSLAARGIVRPPRRHLGPHATAQARAAYKSKALAYNALIQDLQTVNAEIADAEHKRNRQCDHEVARAVTCHRDRSRAAELRGQQAQRRDREAQHGQRVSDEIAPV